MILIGFGYDAHRLVAGRALMLGGVKVPFDKGLMGHSDADVLLHAVIDAIIGALGLGDIGKFFPDTDARYQDIASGILLEKVVVRARQEGFVVGNIDVSVILEEPHISPFTSAMCENIAKIAGIDTARVNVKAKTNEKMGFIGSGEGVAAFAVATLVKGGE